MAENQEQDTQLNQNNSVQHDAPQTGAQNGKKPKKQRLKMQDHPVAGWSKKQTIVAGVICVVIIAVAFVLFVRGGGFGYRSKNGGMVNNPLMQEKQAQTDSASDAAGKKTASVDSENIEYTSNDIDKKGCETLAAMVLDKSKQDEDFSLRQYFYSRGLMGMRYQTDSYLTNIKSQTAEHIDKKLAKAIGMTYSTFTDNYSWLIVTGHKGKTYDGNKYGFDIYWANQGLTPDDAQSSISVLYYNTKSKTYQDGTMRAVFLRKNAVGLDEKSYKADKSDK